MSELIDHLADIAGERDRDVLDQSLLGLVDDLLQPQSTALHQAVTDGRIQRWLTRSAGRPGTVAAPVALPWSGLGHLPALDTDPARRDCLQQRRTIAVPGRPARTLVPLGTPQAAVSVLEIQTEEPLRADQLRVVRSVQRLYCNLHGLLDENERDSLTGLLNRKSFDESFVRAAQDGADLGSMAYWLGVIDIDHFKQVNDRHGHLIGDEVLLLLSGLMRSTFRHGDRLYRFGGEEFVVLSRGLQPGDALAVFEALRETVAQHDFPQVGRLTISIGFTRVSAVDTPSSAFERADQAVYFAKSNGRNAVFDHAALVDAGLLQVRGDTLGAVEFF